MLRGAVQFALLLLGMRQPGWLAVQFHAFLRGMYVSNVRVYVYLGKAINAIVGPFVEAWTGVTLPPQAVVGKNLELHHRGPIVINPSSVIGDNCVLVHGVTIGNRVPGGGAPRLGDNVTVGAYAQLLGPIAIGNNVRIGALAVVVTDVPSGSSVRGAAAKIYPPHRQDQFDDPINQAQLTSD